MYKAQEEIRELIRLLEKDLEEITDPEDFREYTFKIDGLYNALDIMSGKTAGEVY